MTTGRLATGAFISRLQNWLLSAVNNSGAVSPLMRATASSTPVIMPARAARYATLVIITARGRPIDAAASRSVSGTSVSMSSVVRTATGTTGRRRHFREHREREAAEAFPQQLAQDQHQPSQAECRRGQGKPHGDE